VNPNSACKVCFLALGAYVLVGGFSTILEMLAQRPLVVARDEVSLPSVLYSAGISAAISLVSATVFAFLPGAFIIHKAPEWADRWFPINASGQQESHPPSAFFPVGLAIVGVYFIVVGASSFAGGLAQAGSLWWSDDTLGFNLSYASRSLASGAAYLIGGLWLNALARRTARVAA